MLNALTISYLFLGGSGAGASFIASLLGLLSPGEFLESGLAPLYRRLIAPILAAALVVLALGVICLAADLGRLDRVLLLVASPMPTHITIGAYALLATIALTGLLALAWAGAFRLRSRAIRLVEVLSLVAAGVTMVYTGLLLQGIAAVPLWASPMLPVLFALSSLSCGVAIALGSAVLTGSLDLFGSTFACLLRADMLVVSLEAIAGAAVVCSALQGGGLGGQTATASVASAMELTCGGAAPAFWLGFVGMGLALPLAIEASLAAARRKGMRLAPLSKGLALIALAAGALAGGFVLRWCMVSAGAHPTLFDRGHERMVKVMFPFEVDTATDVPLWVQLKQRLVYLINSGYFKPGDQLPTVRGLASEISINYNTVNKAYLSLASDGYIESTRGRGAFVLDLDAEHDEEFANEVDGILSDCVRACRDMGLSLDDIQMRMSRKLQQVKAEEHRAARVDSAERTPRIVSVDPNAGRRKTKTGA